MDANIEAAKQTLRAAIDRAGKDVFFVGAPGQPPIGDFFIPSKNRLKLAVFPRALPAREYFRALCYIAPILRPSGRILLMPADFGGNNFEPRWEATEAFLALGAAWERSLLPGGVVELRHKGASTASEIAAFKKVISLSLFNGDSESGARYWKALPGFVRAHHTLFPRFELRIHHDETIDAAPYGTALKRLAEHDLLKLVPVPSRPRQGKCERMLHRLMPAWDLEVEYVFSRDVDSIPTWRERCLAEAFIESAARRETDAHTIWDNVMHTGIMGGLCAFRAEALRDLYPTFDAFVDAAAYSDEEWAIHGADQNHLNANVAPKLRLFEHDVYVARDESGERLYRKPTLGAVRFDTDVPTFDDFAVPVEVREASNTFINYIGAAGYRTDDALAFYNKRCPVIDEIRDCEGA